VENRNRRPKDVLTAKPYRKSHLMVCDRGKGDENAEARPESKNKAPRINIARFSLRKRRKDPKESRGNIEPMRTTTPLRRMVFRKGERIGKPTSTPGMQAEGLRRVEPQKLLS